MQRFVTLISFIIYISSAALWAQLPSSAYVVNTLGENLSVINLETGAVTPNAATLGLFTNHIRLRNQRAYVVNSGANEIQVIDLATLTTLSRIDLGTGTNPWAIEFVTDNLAAVSLLFTGQVVFVDVQSGQVQQTVSVGNGPEGMVYSNGKLYVANSGFNGSGYDPGMVSAIDVNTFSVNSIPVGINPQALALDSNGNIIVACTGDFGGTPGQLDVIDPTSGTVVHTEVVNATITNVLVNSLDKAYLATFGSGVLVYDLASHAFERDLNNPLTGGPALAVDHQGNALIGDFGADSVFVYSPMHQRLAGYAVGDGPVSLDVFIAGPNGLGDLVDILTRDFTLAQNYPNPFNPSTRIPVRMTRATRIVAEIYNVIGQKVATLWQGNLSAGDHLLEWNGHDAHGRPVPSGHYFLRVKAGESLQMIKMQLIR